MMNLRMDEQTYYVVQYKDPTTNKTLTLKAKKIRESSLGFSFIAISEFVFDTDSVVVNPSEENLKNLFRNTKTLHLSVYAVLSIEEVGKNNKGLKFKKSKTNLVIFPHRGP